jgi:DNA-binding response OmpR family regulator
VRILIVDDEPLVARAIERMLKGHTAACFLSATPALLAHRATPFDLALVDVNLADTRGPILAAELQAIVPVRIVLMSGDSEISGWNGEVLLKPFSVSELRRLIALGE